MGHNSHSDNDVNLVDPLLLCDVNHQTGHSSSLEKVVGCNDLGPVGGNDIGMNRDNGLDGDHELRLDGDHWPDDGLKPEGGLMSTS